MNVAIFVIASFCSTGDHYNPRNCRHGAPEDSERVGSLLFMRDLKHCIALSKIVHYFLPTIILQHVGDLGNILADKNGRASFRLEDKNVKVMYGSEHGSVNPLTPKGSPFDE